MQSTILQTSKMNTQCSCQIEFQLKQTMIFCELCETGHHSPVMYERDYIIARAKFYTDERIT